MKELSNFNILYLEDEPIIRESMYRTLSCMANKVYCVANGIQGLGVFEKGLPVDFIVTDIEMPLMDGLEFVETIKNKNVNIPVIVTTAYDDEKYMNKCEELGVVKVFQKPIDFKELISVLEEYKI